ncbi:hypothetical protein P376_1850 [Streptomyces sp. HCCB10043]|nr:hypothetical protein P376_1850 [Streptomyces sp. HCCB10043]
MGRRPYPSGGTADGLFCFRHTTTHCSVVTVTLGGRAERRAGNHERS